MKSRKRHSPVAARIVSSSQGGPLRTIINGRRKVPTGRCVCLKAKGRALPWESYKVEYPAIQFCEVASPVISILSQPHRLEMSVAGDARPWIYFPDLEIVAEKTFVDAVMSGVPFGEATLDWRPPSSGAEQTATMVIELKSDADERMKDPRYREKLRLAREAYDRANRSFALLTFSRDFGCVDMKPFRDVALSRLTVVDVVDTYRTVGFLAESGGAAPIRELTPVLGEAPAIIRKLSALHVRRIVRIDLSRPLGENSEVSLMQGGE